MATFRSKGWRTPENDKPCEPTPAVVLDFTNAVHVCVTFEPGADGKPQAVLPGAERASEADIAQQRAAASLKPAKPQKRCDHGLFSDEANQQEMFK